MADKPWKRFERLIANYFNGQRVIPSDTRTRGDVLHETLYIEAKKRKNPSVWGLWEDTKGKARKEDKTPVVCISKNGCKGFLIVVHSDDLAKL